MAPSSIIVFLIGADENKHAVVAAGAIPPLQQLVTFVHARQIRMQKTGSSRPIPIMWHATGTLAKLETHKAALVI